MHLILQLSHQWSGCWLNCLMSLASSISVRLLSSRNLYSPSILCFMTFLSSFQFLVVASLLLSQNIRQQVLSQSNVPVIISFLNSLHLVKPVQYRKLICLSVSLKWNSRVDYNGLTLSLVEGLGIGEEQRELGSTDLLLLVSGSHGKGKDWNYIVISKREALSFKVIKFTQHISRLLLCWILLQISGIDDV